MAHPRHRANGYADVSSHAGIMGRWSFVTKLEEERAGRKTTVPAVSSFANNLLLAPTRPACHPGTASLALVDRIVPGMLRCLGMKDGRERRIGQEFDRSEFERRFRKVELNGHLLRPA